MATVALVAFVITLVAWTVIVGELVPMPGGETTMPGGEMTLHPVAPGAAEAMGTTNGIRGVLGYLLVWGLMMVAMMYPSSATSFQWYADHHPRRRSAGPDHGTVVFVGAYTVLWIVVGLVPLAVDAVASIYSLATTWGSLYFGVSFLAVGAFQLSSIKRRYLHRRSYPPGGLTDHAGPELESAARAGLVFGRWDLGSCGVPMGLMVVLGSTNVAWMLPITVALFVERTTSRGVRWASGFGLLAIGVGVWQIGVWFV